MTQPMLLTPTLADAPAWRPGRGELVVELQTAPETATRPGQLVDEIAALLVVAHQARALTRTEIEPVLRLHDNHLEVAEHRRAALDWLVLDSAREHAHRQAARTWGTVDANRGQDPLDPTLTFTWGGHRPPSGLDVPIVGWWRPKLDVAQPTAEDMVSATPTERQTSAIMQTLSVNGSTVGVSALPVPFVEPAGTGRDDRLDYLLFTLTQALRTSTLMPGATQ